MKPRNISTNNRCDILGEYNDIMSTDEWKEVKIQVDDACVIGVPISEDAIKNWTDEMVAYYMVKWKKRDVNTISPQQRLKSKMESIHNMIVHLNRNLHNNVKANVEKMVENSIVTTGDKYDVLYEHFILNALRQNCSKLRSCKSKEV